MSQFQQLNRTARIIEKNKIQVCLVGSFVGLTVRKQVENKATERILCYCNHIERWAALCVFYPLTPKAGVRFP